MKWFIEKGNQYVRESDWKTIALLKLCLCAMGVMVGLKIPRRKAQVVGCAAFFVFLACYVPLIWKMVELVLRDRAQE